MSENTGKFITLMLRLVENTPEIIEYLETLVDQEDTQESSKCRVGDLD